ncbi:hypothetical protein [Sphaerothrix gracilis]|uniref:hypothetical protein n=1 Tax=Sphaerothrix gracilis TaxID=3151835 RepID=UPI0031FCF980
MTEINDDAYVEVKKRIYKYKLEDPVFQDAKSLIKYQSRRIGSLQGWNNRYRQRIELLKQAELETQQLREQLQVTRQTLVTTIQRKSEIESGYDEALLALEKVDQRLGNLKRSYQIATSGPGTASIRERWALVIQAVKDLLFPPPEDPIDIKPDPPDEPDDWTVDSVQNIQRDLYENS